VTNMPKNSFTNIDAFSAPVSQVAMMPAQCKYPTATRIKIATKLPARAIVTIVAVSTAQSNGNVNRQATARVTRGRTMASMGAIEREKSIATANASSICRGGVRQLTPLNASVTTIDAATIVAKIRSQYARPREVLVSVSG